MPHDPAFLLAAVAAVTLVGLAKGGFSGLGALGTPILALTVTPTAAAAILLPILIVQDAVSVWSFRKTWDSWIVAWMLPGALAGVVAGWWLAASVSVRSLEGALGAITLGFGLWRLWLERGGRVALASRLPGWVGTYSARRRASPASSPTRAGRRSRCGSRRGGCRTRRSSERVRSCSRSSTGRRCR